MDYKVLSNQAVLKEIGKRFQLWRLNANISQTDLALRSGVSRTSVERLEKGKGSKIKKAGSIIKQVSSAVLLWKKFANEAEVTKAQIKYIAQTHRKL